MLKKFILAAAAFAAFAGPVLAQTPAPRCVTDAVNQRYREQYPQILQREAQLEADIQRQLNGMDLSRFAKTTGLANDQELYHIPVVFHIIHNYGSEYITDNYVYQTVNEINTIYQKRNADTFLDASGQNGIIRQYAGNIPGTNTKYAARTNFMFHLAQRDPDGRPTNGITRERSYLTAGGSDNAKLGQWAPESYVNIWIVNSFVVGSPAAAYATPPASAAQLPFYDGVNVAYQANGGQINQDNTLAHELGHIFNLNHPFGQVNEVNTGCGDDAVDDTPPTNGGDPNNGCSDLSDLFDTTCTQSFPPPYFGKSSPDVTDTFPDRVTNRGISFFTRSRVRLRNVTIYPHDTVGAPFVINLRRNGTLVASRAGTVAFGNGIPQTVPLSFLIPADSLYTLTFGTNPNARRDSGANLTSNQSGVGGALRITNAGTGGLYNYFYNLDVQYGYFKYYTPLQANAMFDIDTSNLTAFPRTDGAYFIDYPDTVNAQNVMDYTYCSRMFTNGQALRMRAAIRSSLGGRSTLIDSTNQARTGIRSGNDFPARADVSPVADFSIVNATGTAIPNTEKVYICPGKSVTFTNRSWRDTITAATWTFTGGATLPTSTSVVGVSNTFNQAGPVDVTLVVTGNGGSGSDTEFRQRAVFVADVNNKITPNGYFQEFNAGGDLDRYPIFNYFNNEYRWELYPTGYYDNTCIRYKSFDERTGLDVLTGSPQGDYDDFFMPPADLTSLATGPCYLNFMYASASRTTSVADMNDIFEVAYSSTCGDTWTNIPAATMTKGQLHNNGSPAYQFAPAGGYASTQWEPMSITVPPGARISTALFRFRYRPGARRDGSLFGSGNNFYMDRLHFSNAPAGVDAVKVAETGFSLAPNPTNGGATVVLKGRVDDAQLTVTDVTGKVVYRATDVHKTAIYTTFEIPAQAVQAKGIYFVRVGQGSAAHTEKLVVY